MASMRFGAELDHDGVTFRLWAPAAERVDVMLDRAHPMQAQPEGWYEVMVPGARAGRLYKYRIDGEYEIPDPASHYQPEDVFGPSEVIDHGFRWRTNEWRGRPWADAVLLELHVGTFTPGGTFRAAIEKLDHLVETGITAIELMPIADFAGQRNWGYDGVLLYAPDSTYGRPDDLRALIDEAHARGLMVFLDVVYNHFGPEGNYLQRYAPAFFASAHTPWGHAVDYSVPQVRAFAIANALHWLERYRFDGLRLDAVHAIVEPGQPSILHDLSRVVGHLAAANGERRQPRELARCALGSAAGKIPRAMER
jgi:maltooligosyltrehalose trehalohydrolase